MQSLYPCLWFDGQAEEAVQFYASVLRNPKVGSVARYPEGSPGPVGKVMTIQFEIENQRFLALNGGPQFHFTEAVSFVIHRETQSEIDELWEKLGAGGEHGPCGWLKDRFGLSWQVVPHALGDMLTDRNALKSQQVMQALLQMGKIEIARLRQAFESA
ncbi:MAG TPA: VOC family protein [Steroidobacteraceae bacterium]|jgi:predicted 3-demethylubiquinone-9 3-methyltransferase (glyoxalase superfamily)